MKTGNLLFAAVLFAGLLTHSSANAQSTSYVKQIITGNSGKFEFVPPYSDYVNVQSYNPLTKTVNLFDTIYTQSAQFILISGNMTYVAAQDSIVKYNLNTLQRVAGVKDAGLNQLAIFNGRLIVSKQYPLISDFVEVLDTAHLGIIAEVSGISGDCAGISMANDTVYVAVNEGYLGTKGKLAVIDPSTWTLKTELDFGPEAVGIFNLYNYHDRIFSVNKSPYGLIDTGSITVYNPPDRSFTNVFVHHTVGAGTGILDSLLYLVLDNGIGSFNMNTLAVQDSVIVHDPGPADFIISSTLDTLNGLIYANIGDYATPGYCMVTSLTGDSTTSFATGISSDAVAVDYRTYPAGIVNNTSETAVVKLFPNPVSDKLTVSLNEQADIKSIQVSDISGRILFRQDPEAGDRRSFTVPCRDLPCGMYWLILETSQGKLARPFVKK
jgi:hypothetical protein